ncbi:MULTISPECIES: TolC family protein [unclassified Robiginitalea]|uniref:TolC family protein n=1 Tax=Robiginitalea TaxID=252306 RepID=UPI0023491257|nr:MULTISPECIES: TolC family protein [unclassified Robiginitalea]MDC6354945.1 TolC family protein [Robiginitalea sp. PM2]MDC6375211.1 TolC family protein [Robiginitalea sp. SP8]
MNVKKITLNVLFVLGVVSGMGAQEIRYFFELAETNNPELRALRLRHDLAGEKVNEARALPDTEIGAGVFVSEPETRTGAQVVRFSVRQMLPWFGQITARENFASSMAEVEYLDWVIARRQLRLEVAQAYYRLQALRQQIGILEQQAVLLDSYREVALAAVEAGKASAVDVLRLEIRKNDVTARSQVLENQYESGAFAFFRLINATETAIGFMVTELPGELPEPDPPVLGPHPELEKYDRLFASVAREEALNRKSAAPKIGLGLDYIPVAERTDMVIPDSGKDIVMPMVSFSFPLFRSPYKSRTRQNEFRQAALEAEENARRNRLEGMLQQAWQGQRSARVRFATLTENSQNTRQAIEILLKNYQTQQADFGDLLEMQEMELKLELERTEAFASYLSQGALVNYLVAQPGL